MVSPEHGASSSSPSVRIERLERRTGRRPGEEIQITLPDASSFFVALAVWEHHPFREGDVLSEPEFRRIVAESALVACRVRALALLARAEQNRFLLSHKLRQRGFPDDVVEQTLGALEAGGELSDRRYAESWVRARLRSHPEGPSHLVAGLRRRGVPGDIADRAVESVCRDESVDQAAMARALVERLVRKRPLDRDSLLRALCRRGFDRDVAVRAVDEWLGAGGAGRVDIMDV